MKWSKHEDAILMAHYAKHGPSWEGWKELLPDRSKSSISTRVGRLRESTSIGFIPDPYERRVVELMERGMSPSMIDKAMRWPKETAREIMSQRWERDKNGA